VFPQKSKKSYKTGNYFAVKYFQGITDDFMVCGAVFPPLIEMR